MPNIKSAIKRVQVIERNRLRNKSYKTAVKTLTKRYLASVESYAASPSSESMQDAQQRMAAAYSKIDKAVKKGVLHPNTGNRKKARLAKVLKMHDAATQTASTETSTPTAATAAE
ncbi:MAG TPA: 30S ribosomal protein S20 [Elainellaceae cyanobacterium]